MRTLITGGNGFVGRNLIASLPPSCLAQAMSRSEVASGMPEAIFEGDIIVHLAGKAHDLKKISNPNEYYDVNTELTKKLYNIFLASEASKFVFISSVKAATDSLSDVLTEDHLPNPISHYGKSKLQAEEYITSKSLPEGKTFYILRPCMIHGSGNKGNLNLLYNFVSRGIPYPLAAFKNKRSFLSVENLCFIIKEIIERSDIPSGIYNVADDNPLSTTEVVTLLSKAVGKKPRLLKMNRKFIEAVARIGDRLNLPLNTERLTKLTENYIVSNEKIKQVLKKELPLSAEEGILKTAFSFKNA